MRLHPESGLWVDGACPAIADVGPISPDRWQRGLRRWWKEQTALRVEDAVLEAAAGGQVLRWVLPLLSPVLLLLVVLVVREPENRVALECLVTAVFAVGFALLARLVEQWLEHPFWVQLASALFYAVIISMLLWTFVSVEHPRAHAHWILFFVYFLLIGANGLSDDPRLCVCTAAFSIVGYLSVVPLIHAAAAEGSSAMAVRLAPEFEWVANSAKVALLAGAGLLGTASAARGRALRRVSMRDGLTGLLNRHAFDACLDRVALRARKRQRPLSIAMIDIDHFKQVNDGHGHAAGDAVLRWIASRLQRSVRVTDVVARYGGEEFVVAFVDSDHERLRDRLEALRLGIERSQLRHPESDAELRIRVSIGVARLPADGESVSEVLSRADARLYEAKWAGRNRLVDRTVEVRT